jgi:uncharacterized membrane protein YecN with MAPEG domain
MLPSRPVLVRGFVRVLAATAVALAAVTTGSLLVQLPFATPEQRAVLWTVMVLNLLGAPAAAALSLSLAWRSWHRDDARSLATFLAFAAFVLAGDGVWNVMRMSGLPEWVASLADLSIPVCGLAGMAAMLRFSCTFPRPLSRADLPGAPDGGAIGRMLRAAQRWSTDAAAVRRAAVWASVGLILVPEPLRVALAALARPMPELRVVKYVVLGMLVASMAVSAANQRAGYRVADAEGRRRIFWVLEGFLLATAIAALASALKLLQDATGYVPPVPFWFGMAMMAAFSSLLACLAIAMFWAGAVDPALAIRRTAVAGLLGLMMVVLFATLEQALQGWLGQRLGLSDRAGGILTGVAVGLAFEPLRTRTAALVERVLSRGSRAAVSAPSPAIGVEPA